MHARDYPDLEAPDAAYAHARWIPRQSVEWAAQAEEILREHGAVCGVQSYEKRHQARWRALKLIRIMTELRMHERWELKERVEQRAGRWFWSVEYRPRGG